MALKKTLSNYKRIFNSKSKRKSNAFKEGLKLGLLATTNNKKIRRWLESK